MLLVICKTAPVSSHSCHMGNHMLIIFFRFFLYQSIWEFFPCSPKLHITILFCLYIFSFIFVGLRNLDILWLYVCILFTERTGIRWSWTILFVMKRRRKRVWKVQFVCWVLKWMWKLYIELSQHSFSDIHVNLSNASVI